MLGSYHCSYCQVSLLCRLQYFTQIVSSRFKGFNMLFIRMRSNLNSKSWMTLILFMCRVLSLEGNCWQSLLMNSYPLNYRGKLHSVFIAAIKQLALIMNLLIRNSSLWGPPPPSLTHRPAPAWATFWKLPRKCSPCVHRAPKSLSSAVCWQKPICKTIIMQYIAT